MGFHILNQRNEIIGWADEAFETAEGQRLIPDTETPEPITPDLTALKAAKIAAIRQQAQAQIDALQWRVERALEREAIGAAGESVKAVYAEREAIRRASNRAEQEIDALDSVQGIEQYQLTVTASDKFTCGVLTKLQFIQRFRLEEFAQIQQAENQNPAIHAWLSMLQIADFINILDPATITGVQAIEQAGLLAKGRAAQILEVEDEKP